MIDIRLYRRGEHITGFEARGHSGYAVRGEDIVCAAVSAVTTVTVLGLQARLGLDPTVSVEEVSGELTCHVDWDRQDSTMTVRVQDLLHTMALGLTDIANQHDQYVSVRWIEDENEG